MTKITYYVLTLIGILIGIEIANCQQPLQPPSSRFGGVNRSDSNKETQGGLQLQFPDNNIDDILAIYERLIGKPIIRDSSVREGPNVSLVTPNEVSKKQAVQLIEATLLVNGYVLATDPDSNKVTILRGGDRSGGESPSFSESTVIYTDPKQIPQGDSLIGFFLTLNFITPEDAVTIFENHITFNQFGKITPVSAPQGLLITETTPIIRSIIRLRSIIDQPVTQAPLLTEFVPLEHAEANIVAQIIQAAMDARMAERQRQQEIRGNQAGGANNRAGNNNRNNNNNNNNNNANNNSSVSGIGTVDQPAAQLIPDDRLNRIMVVASPSDAAYILELIKEFDKPLKPPSPLERRLKYVKANDILPVIVDILQDTGTGETQLPGGRQIDTRPPPVTSSQLATLTGADTGNNNQNRTNNTEDDVVGGRQDQIAFPIDEVAPISVLVGKTRIIADRQANKIIVVGGKESQRVVMDMIDRLDRRPIQVYLATVIGEMTLSDDIEVGVDIINRFTDTDPNATGVAAGLFTRNPAVNGNFADLSNLISTSPFGPGGGLNLYGHLNSSLDVVVSALESTNRFKVLSRPVVYTQNGKRAEITSGQEVPVPVDTLTDTNNINAVQTSIDFKEVVLKLEVLPIVNENGEVLLDIVQVNDRVIGSTEVAGNDVPIIGKQELNTTVAVANRSTIVLGGLISETHNKEVEGVPFVNRLPLLGNAFKRTEDEKVRSELMIFIQPVVVYGDQEAVETSYDEDVRTSIGQDAARLFPEPGIPTVEQRTTVVNDQVIDEDKKPLHRIGQKIFGKRKKLIREPLPLVAEPVLD